METSCTKGENSTIKSLWSSKLKRYLNVIET